MKFEVGDLIQYSYGNDQFSHYAIVFEVGYYMQGKEKGFRAYWLAEGTDTTPVYYSDDDIEDYLLVSR
jgi:hypothetical protein|tara:strand:- start:7646 stop:7849 length:204 start_codon:yes stop_codon:yes gene_type:complete